MTKDDLVTAVVKSCKGDDLSKRLVSDVIDATFESIGKSIKKEKRFSYPAFGTFTVRNRKARKGRNPQTCKSLKNGGPSRDRTEDLLIKSQLLCQLS